MKIIVYYSRSGMNYVNGNIIDLKIGNAKVISENIQKCTNAELYEIISDRNYSNDYHICIKEAKEDLNKNIRPNIISSDVDFNLYDTVFLVYPNWWSDMPVAVISFLEKYDLSNKTINIICTHEGSGFGNSLSTIKRLQPKAKIGSTLDIIGSMATNSFDEINRWISSIK